MINKYLYKLYNYLYYYIKIPINKSENIKKHK